MKIKQRKDMRVRIAALEECYMLVSKFKDEGGKRSKARYEALDKLEHMIAGMIVETQSKGEVRQ